MDTITGIAGVVVSGASILFAWLRTRSSNKIAERANRIAEGSQQAAEAANQISAESNTIAREANRIAVDANQLAKHANTTADLRQARDEERNDVVWDGDWESPGRYVLTNTGQDEAREVVAVVAVNGQELTAERELVRSTESITLEFPEARLEFMREETERRRRQANSPFPSMDMPHHFHVAEHVTWRTQLGVPRVHDRVQPFSSME